MATIKDVAALAGISYTTVSHVVNKTRPVSEPVRIKVEAAIKQLDYVLATPASSLPDAEPENRYEQAFARTLKEQAGDLFD